MVEVLLNGSEASALTPKYVKHRAGYFGCLKGVSKSVQVLLNGTDFDNSETASPETIAALKVAEGP